MSSSPAVPELSITKVASAVGVPVSVDPKSVKSPVVGTLLPSPGMGMLLPLTAISGSVTGALGTVVILVGAKIGAPETRERLLCAVGNGELEQVGARPSTTTASKPTTVTPSGLSVVSKPGVERWPAGLEATLILMSLSVKSSLSRRSPASSKASRSRAAALRKETRRVCGFRCYQPPLPFRSVPRRRKSCRPH